MCQDKTRPSEYLDFMLPAKWCLAKGKCSLDVLKYRSIIQLLGEKCVKIGNSYPRPIWGFFPINRILCEWNLK